MKAHTIQFQRRPLPTAWITFGVAVAAYIVAVIHRTAFGVAGPDAASRFGIEATALSLLAVAQIAMYAALQVPAGTLLDRWGPAKVIVAGSLVMATGQALMALAPGFGWALFARALIGAGDAPVFIAVARLVALHFPPKRVPLMVQVTGLIGQTGQLASAIPLAYVLHTAGWVSAFGSLAALGVVAAGSVWLVLVRGVGRGIGREQALAPAQPPPQSQSQEPEGPIAPPTFSVADAMKTHWRTPGVRLGFWSHFLGPFAANTVALLWGVPYFTSAQGLSPAQASLLLTCMVIANITMAPFIGALTAAHPLRRSWLVLGAAVVMAVTWTLLLVPTTPRPLWQLIAFVVVVGAGGPMSLVGIDFARSFAAEHRAGSASGFVNMGGFIATVVSVLLVGVVLQLLSPGNAGDYSLADYRIAFASMAVPWVIGVLGVYFSRRDTRVLMAQEGILVPGLRVAWASRKQRTLKP